MMLRMNEITSPVAGYDAAGDHGSVVKRARELSLPCSRKGMRAAPPSGLVILPPVPPPDHASGFPYACTPVTADP